MKKDKAEVKESEVTVKAPRIGSVIFKIQGTAPFVSNKFSEEMKKAMRDKQAEGGTAKSKHTKRDPKDFEKRAQQSLHVSTDDWIGFPASGIRKGLISACRLVNFKMTIAKMSVFIEPDGFDKEDGTPLVRFLKGTPRHVEHYVRLSNGAPDICPRMMFDPGWEASVRVQFDEDQFTLTDIANLLTRVGLQVGIGAGRPDSTSSSGMGWGTFRIVN